MCRVTETQTTGGRGSGEAGLPSDNSDFICLSLTLEPHIYFAIISADQSKDLLGLQAMISTHCAMLVTHEGQVSIPDDSELTHGRQNTTVPIFGSDRSPRRGDVVRACVRPSVRDIIQKSTENEF